MATDRVPLRPFLLSLAAVLAVEALLMTAASLLPGRELVLIGVGRIAVTALILAIFHWRGNGVTALGLGRDQLVPGLWRGALWSVGFAVVVAAVFVGLFSLGRNPLGLFRMRLPSSPETLALLFIVGGIIAPVAEEVAFRGVFYGFLRKWGVAVALVGSTTCFVLLHGNFGITQIVGGLLFATAYEVEGKLMTPIVIHVTGNLALFCLPLLLF